MEVHDFVEGANPTTHVLECGGDGGGVENDEIARVVGGRVGRVRKDLHPRFGRGTINSDAIENMFSGSWNERFGDKATHLEGSGYNSSTLSSGRVDDIEWLPPGIRHRLILTLSGPIGSSLGPLHGVHLSHLEARSLKHEVVEL